MNKPYAILCFVTGALLGVSVTGTVLRIKYAKDLEREVDSVIESFSAAPRVIFKDKADVELKADELAEINKGLGGIHTTRDIESIAFNGTTEKELDNLSEFYYSPENETSEPRTKKIYNIHGEELIVNEDNCFEEEIDADEFPPLTEDDIFVFEEPHSVNPDEFAQLIEDGYDIINWTVYQGRDGSKLVADENDELVNHDDIYKTIGDGVSHLGEFEEDIAFVCNDRLRCVIEIAEDMRPYADVLKAMPFINQ